ncbi:hypothetical protein KY285_031402 [Solanum tuberosum]|nr:hypothetical protein KY284_031193 [Solanum tuberosum]KAH0656520.1 hypothetical protein KY285_031402 [Solanum tuberosum]
MCVSSPGPKVFTYLKLKGPNLFKDYNNDGKLKLIPPTADRRPPTADRHRFLLIRFQTRRRISQYRKLLTYYIIYRST